MTSRRDSLENLRDTIEDAETVDDSSQTGMFDEDGNPLEHMTQDCTVVLCERDRDVLIDFDDKLSLVRSDVGVKRHLKLLRHCHIVARDSDASVADAVDDRDAAEDCLRWVHRNRSKEQSEETNRDYRVALRQLGKRVTPGDDVPDSLSWISATTSSDYDPSPDPAKMISWEEVEELIGASTNNRDRALVAVAWDLGARSGELKSLTLNDISDYEHGLRVSIDGKTGQRSVTLIRSVPYLQQWINVHPGEGDDPLWTRLNEPERLSDRSFIDIFKRLHDRVGLGKRATPTMYRKSSFSYLIADDMNYPKACRRQGRNPNSEHNMRYLAVFDDDVDDEYARLHGIEPDDDEEARDAPLTCPACDRETPRDKPTCVWCGQAMSASAARELEDAEDALVEDALDTDTDDDPLTVEDIRRARKVINNPKIAATIAEEE